MAQAVDWKVATSPDNGVTGAFMSSIARTLSATVGVTNTYAPSGETDGVMRYIDRAGPVPIGWPKLALSVRPPVNNSTKDRMYKITLTYSLPTMEQTSPSTASGIQPAPTIAYVHSWRMEFMVPERGTANERLMFLSVLRSIVASTINASDDAPTDSSGNPLIAAILNFDKPI